MSRAVETPRAPHDRDDATSDGADPRGPATDALSRRATGGFVALLLGQGGQILVQLVTFPILARLVEPEGFGLVAAALVVVNLGLLLATLGLTTSLVQVRDLDATHVRVAFTIQCLGAVLVLGAVGAAAGALADLLRMPALMTVLQVMAAAYAVRALTLGDALLRRELRFRAVTIIELAAHVVGYGFVAVGAAAAGHGVWSLVWGHLACAVVRTVLLWVVAPHPWRPSLSARHRRDLLGTGFGYTLAQAGYQAAHEVDNLVIGRWLGASALGLYERGYRLMRMPASALGHVLGEVLYPAMASVQDQRARLRGMFAASTLGLSVVTVPVTVVTWMVSDELVRVVLGPGWSQLGPLLDVLLLGMYLKAAESVTDSVIVASGAIYRLVARRWLYAGAVLVGALVGQRWGLHGVAIGALAAMTANTVLLWRLSLRLIELRWRDLARLHLPAATTAVVAGAASWGAVALARAVDASAVSVLAAAGAATVLAGVVAVRAALRWDVVAPLLEVVALVERLVTAPRPRRCLAVVLGADWTRPGETRRPQPSDRGDRR